MATQNSSSGSDLPSKNELANSTETTANASTGANSGAELLRRLSLTDRRSTELADGDPKAIYKDLHLSGNVISASICIPHQLSLDANDTWQLSHRHGTSALFDSFAHLSSDDTPWHHTLVGWTGEIRPSGYRAGSDRIVQDNCDSETMPAIGQSLDSARKQRHKQAGSINPIAAKAAGTDTITVSQLARQELENRLLNETAIRTLPVWLGSTGESGDTNLYLKDQGQWRRYAEHELYTLFHYKMNAPDDGRAERKSWVDYVKLNQAFADRIMTIYQAGDIIWIHDYHLMLLPSILRQRIPDAYIGFFLHIPFPSSEYLRCLPRRKDILTGTLGATMIGFQSYSFSRHFNSCCKRILGFESSSAGVDAYGAHVSVDVFPIGIDVSQAQRSAFDNPVIDANVSALREAYQGKKIVIGRDRLDTVRGVAQKLQAFETFLHQYPEWRDKIVLIQVTSPTSVQEEMEDPKHSIETKISTLVGRINSAYGSLSHSPVQHYPQYLAADEYFALLRVADVGLITSVRDGMNTTSLEYVICQRDNHGPLILSEFSGTAASLGDAIHINPWDFSGVAKDLKMALEMSDKQKKATHDKLYHYVTTHTVSYWSNSFLKRLLTNLQKFSQSELTPALDVQQLKATYDRASKRLFMFDYDGTLTPIVKDPNAALPSDKVLRTLKALASEPHNQVWIISGRDEKFLATWMGSIANLGLSAEHGCFIRAPGNEEWENLTLQMDLSWQKEAMEVFNHYTERTQGSWIEKKRVALTWHYRQADPDFGAWQAKECRKTLEEGVLKKFDVEVMSGKANLEIRPRFVNKGYIANRLVHECGYGTDSPPEFVLCLGDDQTDEDMFKALLKTDLPKDQVFTCTVGASSKRTLARWHLLAPADVVNTVGELTKPLLGRTASNSKDTASTLRAAR